MKKVMTLCCCLLIFSAMTELSAGVIDRETARAEVSAFMHIRQKPELAYTAYSDGQPCYYVFNIPDGGFAVAGGNDQCDGILCYSTTGRYDKSSIPPAFQNWLDGYSRQIAFAVQNGLEISEKISPDPTRIDISPIVRTRWGQSAPYNILTPKNGLPGRERNCLTGCVATAMAQVMYTMQCPQNGAHGSHSYVDAMYGMELSGDFEGRIYDWKNMLQSYDGAHNAVQDTAVARLMLDCGIAIEMCYNTGGSLAWGENIPYALVNYFGYDAGVLQIFRDYCLEDEWDNMIYGELINGRPVIFGGATSRNEGHAFVCDGYDASTGKYHFNWGWNGDYDCYCALSALNVGSYGFNYDQDMIIGIKPSGSEPFRPVLILSTNGDVSFDESVTGCDTSFTVSFVCDEEEPLIYNNTHCDVDVVFSLKYESVENGECYIAGCCDIEDNRYRFPGNYPVINDENLEKQERGIGNIVLRHIVKPVTAPGEYRVTLVYKNYSDRDNGDVTLWKEVRTSAPYNNYQIVTVLPTGIGVRKADMPDRNLYDIYGRRTDGKNHSGIYIEQGKKVFYKYGQFGQ